MKKRGTIALKSIIGIVLLLIVFSYVVITIGYNVFTEVLLDQYADGAFRTANIAATYVDSKKIEVYASSHGTTAAYKSTLDKLTSACNSSGATFIYVILPDTDDYAHITFLFSTMNENSHYTLYDFGYVRETTNDDYKTKYRRLYEGESEEELVIRDKGYIETDPHITAMIPLKSAEGITKAILCVQMQMENLTEGRRTYVRSVIITLMIAAVLVIIGLELYFQLVLLNPIRRITEEASRFAEENVSAETKLTDTIKNRDEIGILAESIDQMEDQIHNYVENLTKATAERERISTELNLATRIQDDMLPGTFPAFPNRKEFDIYASMDPAREVGGDFYDYFLVDDDHLCLFIADVSGKGVPAALFMMASMIILANNARIGKSPAEVLRATNESISSRNKEEMFVTVWLGILEISTGRLTAANAGHEYPVLQKANGEFEVFQDKHGLVIGAMEGIRYREYDMLLEPGSKLFLYTDGVPEATDSENRMFGMERMVAALNREPGAGPEKTLKNVRQAVDENVKDAEQFDDLTMLCLKYEGRES